MISYTQTMQARSKPRLRLHSDGKWYCYREHKTAFGVRLGRTTGAGDSAREAWDDFVLLEHEAIDREMSMPGNVRGG